MNRETKRLMQRQGQMEADGSPATRKAPANTGTGGARQPRSRQQGRKRTTPVQFVREVRDEMRQVAWPSTKTAGFPEYERPRALGPDDDPVVADELVAVPLVRGRFCELMALTTSCGV